MNLTLTQCSSQQQYECTNTLRLKFQEKKIFSATGIRTHDLPHSASAFILFHRLNDKTRYVSVDV